MPYEPIVPEGQHLGTSRNVDGAVTGHLFEDGTNDLKGHAAWHWVDDPEEEYSSGQVYEPPHKLTQEEREAAEKITGFILAGIFIGVEEAAPYVKRWWNERALPAVASAWKRVSKPREQRQSAASVSPSTGGATFTASPMGVEVAISKSKISMTRAEWGHRFHAMRAASAFKDEQQRILSNARLEDGETALDAQFSRMEPVTPQQFAEHITLMLELNPSLLDAETSTELMRIFGAHSEPLSGPAGTEIAQ